MPRYHIVVEDRAELKHEPEPDPIETEPIKTGLIIKSRWEPDDCILMLILFVPVCDIWWSKIQIWLS